MFEGKVLLITGGTGSFGNAVLKRFLDTGIAEIRIFSRDEKKQDDMRKKYHNAKLKFYIGDVRDFSSVLNATRGVDYIFHAAALKQVPSCEFHPMEAVKTNVIGTRHGEKLYETLLSREEMAAAEDLGGYYRVPPDLRDLNYGKFVEEGEQKISQCEDYNSHNTERLDKDGMKQLLMKLEFMRAIAQGQIPALDA